MEQESREKAVAYQKLSALSEISQNIATIFCCLSEYLKC